MRISIIILSLTFILNLSATIINIPEDQPTIQEGVNVAVDSDTVLVHPGIYNESINYNGKNITLASLFLTTQDTSYISQTIIEPDPGDYGVLLENGENENAILQGFTIQNAQNTYPNPLAGVKCDNSSALISNNIFRNNEIGIHCHESNATISENRFIDSYYYGVCCLYSSDLIFRNIFRSNTHGMFVNNATLTIINNDISFNQCGIRSGGTHNSNTIVNNTICYNIGVYGYGIECLGNPDIFNNIIWGNSDNIQHYGFGTPKLSHNCLEGGCPPFAIDLGGNISDYPNFLDVINENLRLSWENYPVSDSTKSPCIDSGTFDLPPGIEMPEIDLDGNPRVINEIVDMGAYEWFPPTSMNENIIISNLKLNNFPNPFNPTTTIEFSIQKGSKIELTIYNIKGQKIKTLAHNEFAKGSHSVTWNGDDESGKLLSSGVYFYKLNVNGKTEAVKKCLLLK